MNQFPHVVTNTHRPHRMHGVQRCRLSLPVFRGRRRLLDITTTTSHGPVSVCLCLSVTSRSSTKTAKRRITQTTPHDSPGTLVFWLLGKMDAAVEWSCIQVAVLRLR